MNSDSISSRLIQIRRNMITADTRRIYLSSSAKFLFWLYTAKPALILTPFRVQVVQRHREISKKTIEREISLHLEPSCPPIDFSLFSIDVFMEWILSIRQSADGTDAVAFGALNSHRSALFNLFRDYGIQFSVSQEKSLKEYFKGLKREMARSRGQSHARIETGKDPLQFKDLKIICSQLLRSGDREAIFAHLFLLLTWNLMCRSSNTVQLRYNHMRWKDDCLAVLFSHSKTDQGGEATEPRHVYANPHDFSICLILSLAMYWLLFPPDVSSGKLFPGTNQYERFRHLVFSGFLQDQMNLGTHSIRKGSATYCCAACVDGPNISCIFLRAGWKFPGVGDTYIKHQDAGDQHVGRTVSGLPFMEAAFACLPPFFLNPPDCIEAAFQLAYPTLAAGDDPLALQLRTIGYFCLASLIYHSDSLRAVLPSNHPILSTAFFQHPSLISTLKTSVICRNYIIGDPITPTGLPAYVVQLEKTAAIQRQMEELPNRVLSLVQTDLFPMAGTGFRERIDGLTARMEKILQSFHSTASSSHQPAIESTDPPPNQSELFVWGGRFHAVPNTFSIPKGGLMQILQLWYLGARPLKNLDSRDMPTQNLKKRLSELRLFIDEMEEKFSPPLPSAPSIAEFCNRIFGYLCPLDGGHQSRKRERRAQLSWRTIVDLHRKKKQRSH